MKDPVKGNKRRGENLHSTDSTGNHMCCGGGLGDLQETGQVDQEPKDSSNKSRKQEFMEGSKAIVRQKVRDLGALSTKNNHGCDSNQ